MSESKSDPKRAWVERVLGAEWGTGRHDAGANGAGAAEFRKRWNKAVAGWRGASEAVDSQIGALQRSLRNSGDPDLITIAEYGVNAMTKGRKAPLVASIVEITRAADPVDPALLTRAAQAVQQMHALIANDPRIAACDDNPFGVAVSIRRTFEPPLTEFAALLG